VPAESARFSWRLSRRDWWFIAATVAVAVVITLASVAFSDGARPGAEKGCFSLERASIMGAATTTYCGQTAARFCRTAPTNDREIATKCDALGLKRPKPS
jgi:hypothetical protein